MCDLPALVSRLVAILSYTLFIFCLLVCVSGGGLQDSIDRCPAPVDMSYEPLATATVTLYIISTVLFVCFLI